MLGLSKLMPAILVRLLACKRGLKTTVVTRRHTGGVLKLCLAP